MGRKVLEKLQGRAIYLSLEVRPPSLPRISGSEPLKLEVRRQERGIIMCKGPEAGDSLAEGDSVCGQQVGGDLGWKTRGVGADRPQQGLRSHTVARGASDTGRSRPALGFHSSPQLLSGEGPQGGRDGVFAVSERPRTVARPGRDCRDEQVTAARFWRQRWRLKW